MTRFIPVLAVLLLLSGLGQAGTPKWTTEEGEEYFGEAESYDFETKTLTLRKVDGKTFSFPASNLTFSSKLQLIDTPAFGRALKDYRPPVAPVAKIVLAMLAGLAICTFIGVWGGAHTLGAVHRPGRHFLAFLAALITVSFHIAAWLLAGIILDPTLPIIIDKKADVVMTAFVLVMALLVTGLVLSYVYRLNIAKGLALTVLSGIYSSIVATALLMFTFFILLRADAETLLTKYVFEPFNWF